MHFAEFKGLPNGLKNNTVFHFDRLGELLSINEVSSEHGHLCV